MKHFILTRFNLKVEDWKTSKDNQPVLTEEWLKNRLEIFQNYCFPSVVNQRNQNFHWVVYFDSETPTPYRKVIEIMNNEYPNFKPLYIDGMGSFNSSVKKYILENSDSGEDVIITSRLDNDDAIHQDFVETIQEIASRKGETVIDLRCGYQMNIEGEFHEYRGYYYNSFNPFISLVETPASIHTVFSREHRNWESFEKIYAFDEKPLWIEIVHSKNKYNYVRYDLPLIRKINLSEYGIPGRLKERGVLYVTFNNLILRLKKLIWKMIRKILRRK